MSSLRVCIACGRTRLTVGVRLLLLSAFLVTGRLSDAAPVHLGWTTLGPLTTVGYISDAGALTLFDGSPVGWDLRPGSYPHPLVPTAPLVLLPQGAGDTWPTIVTVSATNKLIRIINGGIPQVLLPGHNFPVGSSIELVQNGLDSLALIVDSTGSLWSIDLTTATAHKVNSPMELFPHGCSISAVAAGGQYHLFAVDQTGTLHYYFGAGAVWNSAALAGGLIPGTAVAADVFPMGLPAILRLNISLIDPAGQLILWSKPTGLPWSPPMVLAAGMSPGASIELCNTAFGPMVSTISAAGLWNIWRYDPMTDWVNHVIGGGFIPGAPILCTPALGTFFTVDPPGRLVCANWNGTLWKSIYALPDLDYAPQLVSRQFVPAAELPPARVQLVNSGKDPLLVQVVDLFVPRQPQEHRVEPGSSLEIELARESGGSLEETFLVPGPLGTLLEQTASHPIPPGQRFTLAMWSDKETYKVLPFKDAKKGAPKSVTEGFSRRSNVSLGVIPVPAGELLQDGDVLDLVQIAKRLNNPGAVINFPAPLGQP